MIVDATTYKVFISLLLEKFSKRAFPNPDRIPTLKELWYFTESIDNKEINLSQHLFISPLKYFTNLATAANRDAPVSINNSRLVKALEFIIGTPSEKKYTQGSWELKADHILKAFEKKYLSQKLIEENQEKRNELLEQQFLEIISYRQDIFNSPKIKDQVLRFIDLLTRKQYFELWQMFTPDMQRFSLWEGDFRIFEHWCNFFESLEIRDNSVLVYNYAFNNIKVDVLLQCVMKPIDLLQIDKISKDKEILKIGKKMFPKLILQSNFTNDSYEKFTQDMLLDCFVQMNLISSFYRPEFHSRSHIKDDFNRHQKDEIISASISFEFYHSKWLINSIKLFSYGHSMIY